jgi:ribosomal-protein-alanine N-acetyltransferase
MQYPRSKLTVRMSNDPAIALYKQEGYYTVDIWKSYYSDGEDGLVMEKVIDRSS